MSYSDLGIVVVSLAFIACLLLFDHCLQNLVEALEALVPKAPVFPHPIRRLLEAATFEAAGSPLRASALGDQAGALQHLQVFADTREAEVERLGQFRDRCLALGETCQDRSPGGVGEGCERGAELISFH